MYEGKTAEELIQQHKYLMISKSWCSDCVYVLHVFKKYNVLNKVELIELDKFDSSKLEKQFTIINDNKKWVPMLFFNGENFGNEQTLKLLESTDRTEEVFKDVGLL